VLSRFKTGVAGSLFLLVQIFEEHHPAISREIAKTEAFDHGLEFDVAKP
jgi:hypothetical protein